MRHYKKGRKLGTDASHTKAIKKSLVANLFLNDRIKTTLERAKEIRPDVDHIITWAKRGDVHSRRLAIAKLGDKNLVGEIFSKVEQGLFKDRPGGYSRIYKVGKRRGDDAVIVLMELVQEPVQFKKKDTSDDEGAKTLKVKKKETKDSAAVEAEDVAVEDAEDVAEVAEDEAAVEAEADEDVAAEVAEDEAAEVAEDVAAEVEDEPEAEAEEAPAEPEAEAEEEAAPAEEETPAEPEAEEVAPAAEEEAPVESEKDTSDAEPEA
jgi:large subunit ribosomal protein L17